MGKPSRLVFSRVVLVCAAFLAACSDSARLQFVTVAPVSGEIYVSTAPAGAVRGAAARGARPALETPSATGTRPEAAIAPVTATCGSLQYAATAVFSNGTTQNVSSTATWISSNKAVATLNSTGLATGIGLGTTEISASFGGVMSSGEPLAVDQLNSITLNPAAPNVPLGGSQSFMAIGNFTFAAGGSGSLDVSSQVTWGSTNPSVATIDNTGKATVVGPGSTTITATSCDGITIGKTTMTVGPPVAVSLVIAPAAISISTGTTTLFTAMELFSDGKAHPIPPGTAVAWSSGTTTAVTIDPVTAIALGVAAGTSTITATETVSGLTGNTTLTVQAAAARFAYIANGGGGTGIPGSISGYTVDVTAATLTPLSGSPFTATLPQQVILHPSGDFMYYLDTNGSLNVEDIKSTDGSLTPSGQPAVPASPTTTSANVGAIDPTGRFIYVISDSGNSIYGFSITQTADKAPATNGALTAIPGMTNYTDPTLNSPTWIMTDRTGKYVYVVNNLGNSVSEYAITQTGATAGALTLLSTTAVPTGAAPFFGTTDVNGHIFVANSGDGTVSVFSIGSGGLLTQVGSSNFVVTGANTVFNVITDPTGKYLYVLDSPPTAGHVFAFNLNTTGAITTQIGAAQNTGQSPIGMAIDPTGALLAIDNNTDNTISLFPVTTSTGAVNAPLSAPANTGPAPQFVVFYTAASGQ